MTTIYTAELVAYDPATLGTVTLRYATEGFVTLPTDTPPHTFYDERLQQPAALRRDLFTAGSTFGRSRMSYGDVVLNNQDGLLDGLLTYGFDGRSVTIRRGTKGAAYPSGFTVVAELTTEQIEATAETLTIKVRDRQFDLEIPLQPNKYAGDNVLPDGLEGVAEDLLGKPKPRCFGVVKNVPAVCVNTAKLIYQVNDGPIASLDAVYDRGIDLGVGFDPAGVTLQTSTFGSSTIFDVIYAGGQFVAVGDAGKLATSTDGTSWTSQTSGFGASVIFGIAYGAGLYVAVGDSGKLYSSPDGVTWTVRTSQFGADQIRDVIFANNLFLAVGASGKVSTSPDGITWTAQTSGFTASGAVRCAGYGAGLYVIGGTLSGAPRVATSPDAITWTTRTTSFPATSDVQSVIFGRDLFVAASTNGGICTSIDGVTWTARTSTYGTGDTVRRAFYANGLFLVSTGISGGGSSAASSIDGTIWTRRETGFSGDDVYGIAFGLGFFVLAGSNGKLGITTVPDTYADHAELLDDSFAPTPGGIKSLLSEGYFRLGSPPAGLVTADVTEGALAGDRTTGQLFARLLSDPLGSPLMEFSSADIAALDTANDSVLGLWVGLDELTVAQALDRIAASVGAWWGVDRHGVLRIQQFTAPSGSPVYAFTADDCLRSPVRVPVTDETRGLPVWRSLVRYARNHAVQDTDLAAGVTDARRAFVSKEWREATDEDAAVQAAHLLAPQLIEDSLLTEEADAQAEATRRQALRGVLRNRFELVVPLTDATDAIDLGEVVSFTHSRYGLSGGPLLRVLGIAPDTQRRALELQVWK